MEWIFEKFKGDACIYGICPKCGFRHATGDTINNKTLNPYNYCPVCGENLSDDNDGMANVIWNERDITALYDDYEDGEIASLHDDYEDSDSKEDGE